MDLRVLDSKAEIPDSNPSGWYLDFLLQLTDDSVCIECSEVGSALKNAQSANDALKKKKN